MLFTSDTGEEKWTDFSVKEKRIVSCNPALAVKQKAEILKEAEKASSYITYKKMAREELGDAAKYITVTNKDSSGKKSNPLFRLTAAKLKKILSTKDTILLLLPKQKCLLKRFMKLTTDFGKLKNLSE